MSGLKGRPDIRAVADKVIDFLKEIEPAFVSGAKFNVIVLAPGDQQADGDDGLIGDLHICQSPPDELIRRLAKKGVATRA